jgi:hypothetical protein
MSLWGIPGPGGSLGRCALCGKNFMKEVITGQVVTTGHVTGIPDELCFHRECCKTLTVLITIGAGWQDLPRGPLRTCFEEAACSD